MGQAGKYDNTTYRGGLGLCCSSSIHRLRLPLSNQGLAQCSKNVVHIIYVRHVNHHGQDSKLKRKRNKPQSYYKDNRDIQGQERLSFM